MPRRAGCWSAWISLFCRAPWTVQAGDAAYHGVAKIIWAYDLAECDPPPLGAWSAAGGAGVWVRGRLAEEVATWRAKIGLRL